MKTTALSSLEEGLKENKTKLALEEAKLKIAETKFNSCLEKVENLPPGPDREDAMRLLPTYERQITELRGQMVNLRGIIDNLEGRIVGKLSLSVSSLVKNLHLL